MSTQEVGQIFGEGSGPEDAMLRSPTVIIASIGLWGMNVYFFNLFKINYVKVLNADLVKEQRELKGQAEDYFRFYSDNKNICHPVELCAEMHERLVTIHPFIDGNGRTARLIMNLILLQNGYPLAILGGDYESRMAYYNALEHVQTHNDKSVFIELIATKVFDALERYIRILEPLE